VAGDNPLAAGRRVISLDSLGTSPNVHLNLDDVARVFSRHLTPRLVDLLELAAYVFSADTSTPRGPGWINEGELERYDRDFTMVMPVRDLSFWTQANVRNRIEQLLNFLTDDRSRIEFVPLTSARSSDGYLHFSGEDWPFHEVERVVMFSGGLDSLAGTVETASRGQRLVLVSHRSNGMANQRQKDLVASLQRRFPGLVFHVPVWVNKDEGLGREHTQRSRSFLFAALGLSVAESVRAGGVRFFENGVVSINLPVAEEVKRSRASRTTHPISLHLMEDLLAIVVGRKLVVDNPFIEMTKEDVVSILGQRGCADLIAYTCSCAHTGYFQSKTQQHCGSCSQCIDRRIAVVAAGLRASDPDTDYLSDVFAGPRKEGYEQNMAVDYVHHALSLHGMGDGEIATRFNAELARAARFVPNRTDAITRFVRMHRRHADAVHRVLRDQIADTASLQLSGRLEPTSLLAKVVGGEHLKLPWRRYGERLARVLHAGLPKACASQKPENEPKLQEVCDGILAGAGEDLIREYPLLRWSSSTTKADWSNEALRVWVELKYVRKRSDLRSISEAIAADITKYGDNDRRTLYVVYDPKHLVTDESKFAEPVVKRSASMMIHFVR
jgi:hypothetical protein